MFTIATIKDLDSGIVSSLELKGEAFTFRSTPPASWTNIEESVKTVSQEEARETLLVWRDRTHEGGRVLVLHEDQLLLETRFGARHLEMLVGEAPSEEELFERALIAQALEEYAERMPNADDDEELGEIATEIAGRLGLGWEWVDDSAEVRFVAPRQSPPDEGPEVYALENASPAAPYCPEAQADLELHNELHPNGYRGDAA